MAKKIAILHAMPRDITMRRCLLPIGLYCNVEIQKAKLGSVLDFWQEWRHEEATLVYRRVINVGSAEFTDWLELLYGKNMTVERLLSRWEAQCITEGIGRDGYDKERALLIGVKVIDDV